MNYNAIFTQIMILFFTIGIGYIANKMSVLDKEANKKLSRLVVKITCPALIISAVAEGSNIKDKSSVFIMLFIACTYYLLMPIIAIVISKVLNIQSSDQGLYQFMTIFSNIGFMGFPVVNAILGPSALLYVGIFQLPFNFALFTIGISLISKSTTKQNKFNIKEIMNAGVIASLIAILIFVTDIKLPYVMQETISLIGHVTTPVSMLVMGSSLALIPIRDVFTEIKLYPFALIKLIIIPTIIYFIGKNFIHNDLILGVLVIMSSMPVASNSIMLCNEYNGNQQLVTKGVFITTCLSIATIPLIVCLLSA